MVILFLFFKKERKLKSAQFLEKSWQFEKKEKKKNLINVTIFFFETFQRVPFTMSLGTFLKKEF